MTGVSIDLGRVARELTLEPVSVERAVALLDSGATTPFITRYRRDQTGGLDEQRLDQIRHAVAKLRHLEERRQTILRSIESQGKLTEELRQEIAAAQSTRRLDDLYLPFKPKKQTLAAKAREQGLGPLAEEILTAAAAAEDLDRRAADFVNPDKGVPDPGTALIGAGHILSERFSEGAELRAKARKLYRKTGKLTSSLADANHKKKDTYKDYHDYREPLSRVAPHRVLAINRGEKGKALRVGVECDEGLLERVALELFVPPDHPHRDFLSGCVRDGLARLIIPSLEREARRELTEKAEEHAISVFGQNLRRLLLQPPLRGKRILAVDPGYKAGCKLAALDEFGNLLAHGVVHLVGSDERKQQARTKMTELVTEHDLNLIAVGNGSACRQTEEVVADILASDLAERDVRYAIVNEAGASVYSTSALGREEFPDCDPLERSAISIGRRLQDPLSELVKIDPASIGVGLYQHDARDKRLRDTLDDVVQSCVSFVGVDLNSSSPALLRYVSGLNQLIARRIYEHRQQNGPFKKRSQLLEVSGVGAATFEQAAGFLKVEDSENPFDSTWVHPESYAAAEKLLELLEVDRTKLREVATREELAERIAQRDRDQLASELAVGRFTLDQIIEALAKPGRDPRLDSPPPVFRRDVMKFEDLHPGLELQGSVLNVVDFGAFVDIGLSDSALVHVSQMSVDFVRDPHSLVAVGDQVKVWVVGADAERRRVSLTMVKPGSERPRPAPKRERASGPKRQAATSDSTGAKKSDRPRRQKREVAKSGARSAPGPRGSFEKRAKREVKPITKEMEEGKEALRSFSDLLQFHRKKDAEPGEGQA